MAGVIEMSDRELTRLRLMIDLADGRLTVNAAATLMGLGRRQIYRLRRIFSADGPAGLASRKRGRPSNRKYGETFRATVLSLVREHYPDFGPTLAVEKLVARHGLRIGVETLRQWMMADRRLPLLVRRQAGQHRTALRGLRGKAAARAPALTRAELIAELAASNPHLRQEDAELIVATVFDQITAALARGERVELRGFGAFTMRRRNARIGRNPRTQETVQVDEKTVPLLQGRHGNAPPAQWRWDEAPHLTAPRIKPRIIRGFSGRPICPDCPRRTARSHVSRLASCPGSGDAVERRLA